MRAVRPFVYAFVVALAALAGLTLPASGSSFPGGGGVALPVSVANGGTGLSSFTTGDILYASGATTLAKLAAGTSGYNLQANGAGVAPSWAAPSAGGVTGIYGPYTKTGLTAGSATSFVGITPAASTGCTGFCLYTVDILDASNIGSASAMFSFASANIGGTTNSTLTVGNVGSYAQIANQPGGSFGGGPTCFNSQIQSGNEVRLRVQVTYGSGTPTTHRITYYLFIVAQTQPTVTPL